MTNIHLDISPSLYGVTGNEGFRLFHVKVEGLPGRYWAEFRWNPGTLSFQPIDAGLEQGYIIIGEQELKNMIEQKGNLALFLSILSSKKGGGIWGVALQRGPQGRSAPAFHLQHTQNPAPLFPLFTL